MPQVTREFSGISVNIIFYYGVEGGENSGSNENGSHTFSEDGGSQPTESVNAHMLPSKVKFS